VKELVWEVMVWLSQVDEEVLQEVVLLVVMDMEELVVEFPAASRATAVMV
jgi:hypothetical protein